MSFTAVDYTSDEKDTGCVFLLARFHQVAADPNSLNHQFGQLGRFFSVADMLRAASYLKSKAVKASLEQLRDISLPAIAQSCDGKYFILAQFDLKQDKILIQSPDGQRPKIITSKSFSEQWNGKLILIAKRSLLTGVSLRFDISWFIPAIIKHKKLLTEVLIASCFIQLFALITPLFFQITIDKVLVHHSFTTLDVLAIGLLVISVFEVVLNGLHSYLFSHTTNRIDVTLGSQLFQHLMQSPISYFQSRQIGTTAARVRELDTVRNFITGSALTLVIDIFFTFVFFLVMHYYSPTLFYVVLGTIPFFIILSAFITPILRKRLDEKFKRGAENQAFLVESVSGVETLKSMPASQS